jgi:hypothetical protein
MKAVFARGLCVVSGRTMNLDSEVMFWIYRILLRMLNTLPYLMAEPRNPVFHLSGTPEIGPLPVALYRKSIHSFGRILSLRRF